MFVVVTHGDNEDMCRHKKIITALHVVATKKATDKVTPSKVLYVACSYRRVNSKTHKVVELQGLGNNPSSTARSAA